MLSVPVIRPITNNILQSAYESAPLTQLVNVFQQRNEVDISPAIALVNELPDGCYLAGGCFKSLILKSTPKDWDIYFDSQEAFLSLIRRIQNAPEGTLLHGYLPEMSLVDFAKSSRRCYNFEHPDKQPLQLVRIAWLSDASDAIAHFDMRHCMIALDTSLRVTFAERAVTDIKSKRIALLSNSFPSTPFRMLTLHEEGWTPSATARFSGMDVSSLITTARNNLNKGITPVNGDSY
jgi:hypothetical protein